MVLGLSVPCPQQASAEGSALHAVGWLCTPALHLPTCIPPTPHPVLPAKSPSHGPMGGHLASPSSPELLASLVPLCHSAEAPQWSVSGRRDLISPLLMPLPPFPLYYDFIYLEKFFMVSVGF